MIKNILAVIVGYIAMAAFVFLTFSAVYMITGSEGAFVSGSYEVSTMWILASIVLGFVGAVVGGLTSSAMSKSARAPMVLAGLVLVLGLVMAIPTVSAEQPESMVRQGDVAMMDAMNSAQQPSWLAFLNPFIGAFGVVVGSRCRKKPFASPTESTD